jgi:predicted small lipoprotein YifL
MRWLALPVLLALAACGQKGNLYLPDANVQTVPVSTPATITPVTSSPADASAAQASPPAAATVEQESDRDKPARRN